jgi:hypothetical protein
VQLPLEAIARAHEAVETRKVSGRLVVRIETQESAAYKQLQQTKRV